MRTSHDVMRSLRRYVSIALGSDWEVRNWIDEGSFAPPIARVAESGPSSYSSRRVVTDVMKPVQIHCYQSPPDSASAARSDARRVEALLVRAIEVGVDLGRPRRIPLYDYDGVADNKPSDARNYYDYMRVLDFSVNSVFDPDDQTIVVVVADLRIAWSAYTTVDVGAKTVESVRVEERAS